MFTGAQRARVDYQRPYPISLRVDARPCLVVGGGRVALPKARALHEAGARLTVVSPEFAPGFDEFAGAELRRRRFESGDVDGMLLAIAATDDPAVNHAVHAACGARGVLCNVVDDPALCDFTSPAVVQRGALQVAVSTAGAAPALARRLRMEIDAWLPEDYDAYTAFLRRARARVRERAPSARVRARIAEELASREGYERFAALDDMQRDAWIDRMLDEAETGEQP